MLMNQMTGRSGVGGTKRSEFQKEENSKIATNADGQATTFAETHVRWREE